MGGDELPTRGDRGDSRDYQGGPKKLPKLPKYGVRPFSLTNHAVYGYTEQMKSPKTSWFFVLAAFLFFAGRMSAQIVFSGNFVIQQPSGVFYIFEASGVRSAPVFTYINYNTREIDFFVAQTSSPDGSFSGSSGTTGRLLSGKVSSSSVTLTYNATTVSSGVLPAFGFSYPISGHYNGVFGSVNSGLIIFPNGFAYYLGDQSGVGSVDANGFVTIKLLSGEILSFRFAPVNGIAVGTAQSSFFGPLTFSLAKTDIQRLVNISTRAFVQGGNHILIAGFIVRDGTKAVVIRAIGPSLIGAGIPDPLLNPRLDIFQGQTLIASNADWRTNANAGEIQAGGLAPTNDKEAALLITLAPGAYTAQVSSEDSSQGVALVEVYDIK